MQKRFDPTFPFRPAKWPFFYGWVILVVSSIGIVASIPGQTMGFSVFTPMLEETLKLSSITLSFAYLVGTISSGLLLPKVGTWFDKFGARALGTWVSVLMGAGLIYLSQIDHLSNFTSTLLPFLPYPWITFTFITFGFFWLRFSGQGALTMTSRSMLSKWFNYYRGLAISLSGVVVSFSFSLAPRVLDVGIEHFGWSGVWFGLGCVMILGMSVFAWLFFRDNPEECELKMDGSAHGKAAKETNTDLIIHREFTRNEALNTPAFWICNLALGLHSFAITGYTFQVVSIAEDIGIDKSLILKAFVPASIIGIVISLIAGAISSKVRIKYLTALIPLGGLIFALGPAFNLPFTRTLLIIGIGTCGGTFGMISAMVWPRFFGRKHLGAISSVAMATMVYASAIAPLFFSGCYRLFNHYQPIFALLAVCYLVSLISCFWADNPQRKLGSK